MPFPTISLALIAKNEEKNIDRLLDSVEGCMDEIILVDTGSTDRTKEIAEKRGCKVYDFAWVNSFCKARNFAFSKTTMDYVLWMDLDDVLSSKEGFIQWKNHAMQYSDMWFATYNYALDQEGKPVISFVRERVFRRSLNPVWRYDLHEGVFPETTWSRDYAIPWKVNHMRDMEDIKADKSRNISILEAKRHELDGRLQFYYGKELYEANRPHEAMAELTRAVSLPDLEHHDKVLAYQYAAYSAQACGDRTKDEFKEEREKYYSKAIDFAFDGIKLDTNRAEFYIIIGDICLKRQEFVKAVPMYATAKACIRPSGGPYEGAIYSYVDCYGQLPSMQLAKIYFNIGKIDDAEKEALECANKYKNKDAEAVLAEIRRIKPLITLSNNQKDCDDIVFTCPAQLAYPFDEELYKTKGMGGSETALIEMARNIKKITGRPVKVFNPRETDMVADSGVEYISNTKQNLYFSQFKPKTHVAWRHNIRVTEAPTYLWCHDLATPGVESIQNFEKHLCLTEFHKNYVMARQSVDSNKIIVTRNGINPEKFIFNPKRKNPNKIVFMSSPDRGLGRAMKICDELIKKIPAIELHVYYGLDNLYKYGLATLAETLKGMMDSRPYVKYHGFTEQSKMYQEVSDATIWLHPATFIETSCMTAMEMLALKIYPVTNSLGALQNTLGEAKAKGWATLLEHDIVSQVASTEIDDAKIKEYADATYDAIFKEKWMDINFDFDRHSWESVAKEWVHFMGLDNAI